MNINKELIARNILIVFIGQIIPLLAAVIAIPIIVRGLGADRFGILSISWLFLGYFSVFDLGLGKATTKFVATHLGEGKVHKLPQLIWVSVCLGLLMGIFGMLVLKELSPFLSVKLFKLTPPMSLEMNDALLILSVSLPVVLVINILRGSLEAAQRFDLINVVRISSGCLVFIVPVVALHFGAGLVTILISMVLINFLAALSYLVLCLKVFPILIKNFSFDFRTARNLLIYGGWTTIFTGIGAIILYIDRFFIGALVCVGAVTYYTVPYEVVTRLGIFYSSLETTLFPTFSVLWGSKENKSEVLFVNGAKYVLLLTVPVVFTIVLFARELLGLWLGNDFTAKSTLVLQILIIAFLINSFGRISYPLIQGAGRPDILGKFHLLELPIYGLIAWLLISKFGIIGAAVAWLLRAIYANVFLFYVSIRLTRVYFFQAFIKSRILMSFLMVVIFILAMLSLIKCQVLVRIIFSTIFIILYSFMTWRYVLCSAEKKIFGSMIKKRFI